MEAPQIIWIALAAYTIANAHFHDGEPKTGRHDLVSTVVAVGISAGLLYWGGFFG